MVAFFEPRIEKSILICLINDDNIFSKLYYKGLPDIKIFADKSHRIIYDCVIKNHIKYGKIPTRDVVISHISRLKVNKGITNSLKEKAAVLADRLYDVKVSNEDRNNFDVNYNELISLYELRLSQNHIKLLSEYIDNGDIDNVKKEIGKFNLVKYDEDIEEFDYIEGLKERVNVLRDFKKNRISPIPTGIPELDNALDGGFFAEYVVIVGNSSTGKSSFLHQICKQASINGKTGMLFTIEMDKVEAATRIDADISDIPLKKFRNPIMHGFNNEDVKRWQNRLIELKKSGFGDLHIIAFLKGATVNDIIAKAQAHIKRIKKKIDYVAIDYLNDLKPIGNKYSSEKEWSAQAEISWDLHLLNKNFVNYDGSRRIPVITAAMMKSASRGITSTQSVSQTGDNRRIMDERDLGLAKIIYAHSNICLGIREVNSNMNQVIVMKARGAEKGKIVEAYPNFSFGRFHDIRKEVEMKEMRDVEIEDSQDGVVIIDEGDEDAIQ